MLRHRDATDIGTHPGMRKGIQSVALEIAWEEDTLAHLSHLFSAEPDIHQADETAVSRAVQAEVKQNSCRGHVRAFHNPADGKFPAIDTVLSTPATENAAHEIDKTLEFFSVVTMALSVLHLSYLVNEIFLSTVSHQRHVEQGKHGITPVMIEVNGPEVLGTYNLSHLFIVITLHGNLSLPRHENSQQFFS